MKEERMNSRASALLRKSAGGFEPSAADKSRTRAAIGRRVAIGLAAGSALAAGAKTAAAAPSLAPAALASTTAAASAPIATTVGAAAGVGFATKLVATVAILGTISAGAVTVRHVARENAKTKSAVTSQQAAPPTTQPIAITAATTLTENTNALTNAPQAMVSAPTAVPPTVGVAAALPIANPAENKPKTTAVANAIPEISKASTTPTLQTGAEVELLQRAQQALGAGDATTALSLLNEQARRFPNGALAEEREAARVLALCAAGRQSDAQEMGAAFLNRYPTSPHASRVRSSCAFANANSPQITQ